MRGSRPPDSSEAYNTSAPEPFQWPAVRLWTASLAARASRALGCGGGGGGAQNTNAGTGGGDTSFGSWTAKAGSGGGVNGAAGGAGGTEALKLRSPGRSLTAGDSIAHET